MDIDISSDPLSAELELMETGVTESAEDQSISVADNATANAGEEVTEMPVITASSSLGPVEQVEDDDEFGLVEAALAANLRPVIRRCDEVLSGLHASVHVSGINSEQRRALGRVDGSGAGDLPKTDIVQDPIKLEVEEHEVPDDADWTPPVMAEVATLQHTAGTSTGRIVTASRLAVPSTPRSAPRTAAIPTFTGYGKPYKTTSSDRRSRVLVSPSAATAMARGSRGRGRGPGRPPRGRPLGHIGPSRGGIRVATTSSLMGGRGGGKVVRARGRPPSTHLHASRAEIGKPIFVLQLAECLVEVVRDKLMLHRTSSDDDSSPMTQMDLSFMDLVKIKEAITKLVEKVNSSGPEEHVGRLRTARRQSITWVEARLKMDAEVDSPGTPMHGKLGKSKYNVEERRPPVRTPLPVHSSPAAAKSPAVPAKAAPRVTPRAAAAEPDPPVFVDDGDDPDFDPEAEEDFDSERVRKMAAAHRPPTIAPRPTPVIGIPQKLPEPPTRVLKANFKTPKASRDIVILQAKLRDLQNVGVELRRAVDYFNLEAQKDKAKVLRLKVELNMLEKKKQEMEENIFTNANPMLIGLLDKEKRKLLTGEDQAVVECGELLSEVGRENYNFVMEQGLPLLSAKDLEEKTRGVAMHWSLDPAELTLASASSDSPSGRGGRGRGRGGRGRGRGKKRPVSTDPGAAVDAAVAAVVSRPPAPTSTDGEQISLPPEVLEQVMNGKGYLVDENGERLEIRMVGDAPVIAS